MKRTAKGLTPLLIGIAVCVSISVAQSTGTFTVTGNMTTSRFGHTATLLADGRVLIAGGYTGDWDPLPSPQGGHAITATAELYDPATGTFTPTGSTTTARSYHTATLLPDGRVLIAAGLGAGRSDLASAELYDPSSGTFTATGDMSTPSSQGVNTATLLRDGRVLITGSPFRAELYDPATGTFTVTGNMTVPPPFATAALLPDGRVLLAHWFDAKIYDPGTGTFSLTGTTGRAAAGRAILLANGKVLLAGANDDDYPGPIAGSALYDPSIEMFTATGNMTAPRANHTATLLPDGRVLIAGGSSLTITTCSGLECGYWFCCLSSAELYDPATGFANTSPMAAARAGHTATLLNSGKVLIAGGGGGRNVGALATAELHNPDVPMPGLQ